MSFTGHYRHSIDAKGRVIVPSRLRDELEDNTAVLMRWPDGCIALWSGTHWRNLEQSLIDQRKSNPAGRTALRTLGAYTFQEKVDGQGRITIHSELREHAKVERDVVIVGAYDHAEIWSPAGWQQEQAKAAESGLEELTQGINF